MKPPNNAPIYACIYQGLAELVREHGYALAVHGSLARDFDLICIPWIERPRDPEAVVRAITEKYALRSIEEPPALKPHGRLAYTLIFKWGDTALDLQFMPATAYKD